MIHHNEDSLVNFHCCALPNIHRHIHTIARPTHIYYHMYNFFGILAIYNVLGWPNWSTLFPWSNNREAVVDVENWPHGEPKVFTTVTKGTFQAMAKRPSWVVVIVLIIIISQSWSSFRVSEVVIQELNEDGVSFVEGSSPTVIIIISIILFYSGPRL